MKLKLIEGLCYTHPHHAELVAGHPVMCGVWRKCVSLVKEQGAMMAPMLVDDRPQAGEICEQSVETLLMTTTGKGESSFPWLGPQISEAQLQSRYGTLGCVKLDVLYHLHVLWSVSILEPNWKWTVVHPVSFQDQQAGMLAELWLELSRASNLGVMAQSLQVKKEIFLAEARESVLGRFSHHWVGETGRVVSTTRPVWRGKKILHEPQQET